MKYLKVWTDFENVLSPLDDAAAGRLFRLMLRYARDGEEPTEFVGNEAFLWPAAKRDIDMAAEWQEKCRTNGLKGGRPKTEKNPLKPTKTQTNPTEPNNNLKENKIKEKKGNENKSFIDDDEAAGIARDHDRVINAAESAGFTRSDAVRAKLIDLYATNGLEKMIEGINSCVIHGAPNIAYLAAVLKGEPKKQKAVVPVQAYSQRDYSGEQEEAMLRMLKGAGA